MAKVFDSFEECYAANQHQINDRSKKGRILNLYHFELKGTLNLVVKSLRRVIEENSKPFKINLGFGYILKNVAEDRFKFFHPSNNNTFLAAPKLIQTPQDVEDLINVCSSDDILEFVYKSTLTSSWVVNSIVCLTIRVYKM